MAVPQPRSLGILGGTFNPPHLGHLALARVARDELRLERVLLVPANTPPHKPAEPLPPAADRARMAELLVAGEPGLEVCAIELERGGVSYTVDTLESIHAGDPDAELTFIVGADSASSLPAWREPARVLELAELAVAARPGSDRREVLDAVRSLDGARSSRVRFLPMAPIEISSSQAREHAARGEPIEPLVGPAVARYVTERRLYGAARGDTG